MPRVAIEDAATRLRRTLARAQTAANDMYAVANAVDPHGVTDADCLAVQIEETVAYLLFQLQTVHGLDLLPVLSEAPRRRRSLRKADSLQVAA